MSDAIASLSLSGRVVLLTITHLAQNDETPAHTGQVIRANADHLDGVEVDTLGTISEAEVSRALNRLEAEKLVEMAEPSSKSPVGKGRPAYTLAVDTETIIEALADDDDVAPLVEQIAEN